MCEFCWPVTRPITVSFLISNISQSWQQYLLLVIWTVLTSWVLCLCLTSEGTLELATVLSSLFPAPATTRVLLQHRMHLHLLPSFSSFPFFYLPSSISIQHTNLEKWQLFPELTVDLPKKGGVCISLKVFDGRWYQLAWNLLKFDERRYCVNIFNMLQMYCSSK